jgi:hypothetical protein
LIYEQYFNRIELFSFLNCSNKLGKRESKGETGAFQSLGVRNPPFSPCKGAEFAAKVKRFPHYKIQLKNESFLFKMYIKKPT